MVEKSDVRHNEFFDRLEKLMANMSNKIFIFDEMSQIAEYGNIDTNIFLVPNSYFEKYVSSKLKKYLIIF